jgi:hypothetical protein
MQIWSRYVLLRQVAKVGKTSDGSIAIGLQVPMQMHQTNGDALQKVTCQYGTSLLYAYQIPQVKQPLQNGLGQEPELLTGCRKSVQSRQR